MRGKDQEDHDDGETESLQRRAGTALFLEGLAGPGNSVAVRQGGSGNFVNDLDRIAGTDSRLAVAHHLGGDETVETLDLLRADDALDTSDGGQRNHGVGRRAAYVDLADIVGFHPVAGFGLQLDAIDAAGLVEVVDVERSHRTLQRRIDIGDGNAKRQRLLFVNLDEELRHGWAEEG